MRLSRKADPRVATLDILVGGYIILAGLVVVLIPHTVADRATTILELCASAVIFGFSALALRVAPGSGTALLVRSSAALVVFGILFSVAENIQHAFIDGWMDPQLVSLDRVLFGREFSLLLEPFVMPVLTEWLMFSYVFYLPLLPIAAWMCYRGGGETGVHDYLLNLGVAYVVSYVGFMLFPLATQMHFAPEQYTVPLAGGMFTEAGEWIRYNLHKPGGALPSPHCAAATVILIMVSRYASRYRGAIWFIVLSIFVSTIYCRFHYLWDAVAGIAVGAAAPLVTRYVAAGRGSASA